MSSELHMKLRSLKMEKIETKIISPKQVYGQSGIYYFVLSAGLIKTTPDLRQFYI